MSNLRFVNVSKNNIILLENFVIEMGAASNTFRYYDKRSLNVIENHMTTLLLLDDGIPAAYGHLERENNVVWLGICVLPLRWGQGLGKYVIEKLIESAKELKETSINLTVDKTNLSAISLYEKVNFRKICENEHYFTYQLTI
jgi:GNAT superfamily N-acetyltransferase